MDWSEPKDFFVWIKTKNKIICIIQKKIGSIPERESVSIVRRKDTNLVSIAQLAKH